MFWYQSDSAPVRPNGTIAWPSGRPTVPGFSLTMTADLQRQLQSFFQDGLVAVVELAILPGGPTMPDLAAGLRAALPTTLSPQEAEEWGVVEQVLDRGDHLERALDAISHQSPLVDSIIATTADLILAAERIAIDRLSRGEVRFHFAELLPLIAVDGTARVITTNYDRLIELAAEVAGLFLDTGFVGSHYAVCDPSLSHAALKSATLKRGKKLKLEYRPHVVLAKPHGSLDWYAHGDVPIRSPYPEVAETDDYAGGEQVSPWLRAALRSPHQLGQPCR